LGWDIVVAMADDYMKVGCVDDFPTGEMKKVQLLGEEVLVVNVEGRIYAIGNKCTHRGGPLDEGELEGTVVICPWHGGTFDLATGKTIASPPMKDALSFDVLVQGSDVLLKKR
jgi:nitrite reductase/ring-hydroxylating ferredoxin subunit